MELSSTIFNVHECKMDVVLWYLVSITTNFHYDILGRSIDYALELLGCF